MGISAAPQHRHRRPLRDSGLVGWAAAVLGVASLATFALTGLVASAGIWPAVALGEALLALVLLLHR